MKALEKAAKFDAFRAKRLSLGAHRH